LNTLLLREPLDLVACKRQWLQALAEAKDLFDRLPSEEVGCLYLDGNHQAVIPDPAAAGFSQLRRHFGSVCGAWPAWAIPRAVQTDEVSFMLAGWRGFRVFNALPWLLQSS
jgi:hypothetical protein